MLDTHAHKLTGPTGEIDLDVAVFVVLRELMRRPGAVVTLARLTEASWPDPDCEPDDVPQALRQRVSRSRAALKRVGVPGSSLRLSFQVGYAIDGAPRVVRALTPAQAAALDALAATHPAFQPERIAA